MQDSKESFKMNKWFIISIPLAILIAGLVTLLVLDKKTGEVEHKVFTDIIDYLEPGDVLVRNNTKVIPARLYGKKE